MSRHKTEYLNEIQNKTEKACKYFPTAHSSIEPDVDTEIAWLKTPDSCYELYLLAPIL